MMRWTRLAELVNTMDPKMVAAAFGMDPQGEMSDLADHLDDVRLPAPAAACRFTTPALPPALNPISRGMHDEASIKSSRKLTRQAFPCLWHPDGAGTLGLLP
jgi:hypothetical protein